MTFSWPGWNEYLWPTLQTRDLVILSDNLSSHKVDRSVQQAIIAVGARTDYLPPYSPDLNPIEKLFSKLKTLLRKAAKRSAEELPKEIGEVLNTVTPSECANYLASSGVCLSLNSTCSNRLNASGRG